MTLLLLLLMKLVLDLTLLHHNLSDISLVSCFILQRGQLYITVGNKLSVKLYYVDLLQTRLSA